MFIMINWNEAIDDETHRMNNCSKWMNTNFSDRIQKPDFSLIYSNESDVLNKIIDDIECIWDTKYANGRMKRTY